MSIDTQIAPTESEIRLLLGDMVKDVLPTGSRVICPAATWTETTDYDFVVHVGDMPAACARLLGDGFETTGSMAGPDGPLLITPTSQFVSLKSGLLNIIATPDADFFGKFGLATRVATNLGLTNKSDRIALFQAILYGNG